MKNAYSRFINFAILSVLMPFVYGCGGGGGSGSGSLSSVVGSSSGDSGTISSLSTLSGTSVGGGESLASIHNPEPATMLLISGGLAAMAIYRNRQRK